MRLLDAIASEVLDKPASLTGTSYASALRGMYRVRAEIGSTRAVPMWSPPPSRPWTNSLVCPARWRIS